MGSGFIGLYFNKQLFTVNKYSTDGERGLNSIAGNDGNIIGDVQGVVNIVVLDDEEPDSNAADQIGDEN